MKNFTVILKEPVKSKFIEFLDKRISRLDKRNKNNKTSAGRLRDLKTLVEANLPLNNPPKFLINKIEELSSERQPDGEL